MQFATARTEYFYAKDLTARSRHWYDAKLAEFFSWMQAQGVEDVEGVTVSHIRQYMTLLRGRTSRTGKSLSTHTTHGHARVLRNFFNFCFAEGWIEVALGTKIPMPKREMKVVDILTKQDIESLLTACRQKSPILTARDTAMVAVLADTGIRASELLTLTGDRVRFSLSDAYIVVLGKGRKQREASLGKRSRLALHRYLTQFRPKSPFQEVFLARDRKPLQLVGLENMLNRLEERARLRQHLHPHIFRHSFAFHYLDGGGDVARLSRLLGHTSLAVTELYIRSFTAHEARQGQVSLLDRLLL